MGVSRHTARYWALKQKDESFHPNSRGGARRSVFSKSELVLLQDLLWTLIKEVGDLVNLSFLSVCASHVFERVVTTELLSRILQSWRWRYCQIIYFFH